MKRYGLNRYTRVVVLTVLVGALLSTLPAIPVLAEPSPDLIILHTNDIHGRIEADDDLLGMPGIRSLLEYYREQHAAVLVMDAGDTIHGLPVANQLDGRGVVETMNLAGYDVMVPGNHDFNFGYERLLELEELMSFDLVAANVYKGGELLFNPYVVREVGEYRVGVFGLATPDTYQTTHPRNVEGVDFTDMVEAARVSVEALRREGVDLIVALGHVGLEGNHPSTRVVEQVDGIDLFVDGHSHHLLTEGMIHEGTLIVQAQEYSKYLGKVEVYFAEAAPRLEASVISPADAARRGLEPDQEVLDLIADLRDEIVQRMMGTWEE